MIAFIVNPISASGRGKRVWAKLEPILRQRQVPYTVHFTNRPKHALELVKAVLEDERLKAVVAVGGDGTVHEVAQVLVGTDCPLGFIPCGSGNDFARALDIPANSVKALERILSHRVRRIDIAQINGQYFVNGAGIGFDAAVADATNGSRGKQWLNRVKLGRFAYLAIALKMLFTFRPTDVVLDIDGKTVHYANVWLIAVSNIPYYAGGMKICPGALHDDGLLDVCIVNDMSRPRLLQNLARVFKGTHVSVRGVTMAKAKAISIRPVNELPVHTDGECYQSSPVKIVVSKQAMHIL